MYHLHPLSSRRSVRSQLQLQQGQITDRRFALACRNAVSLSHDPSNLSLCQRTGAVAMSGVLAPSFLLELGAYAIAAAGIRLFRNRTSQARQQEAQEHPQTVYQVSVPCKLLSGLHSLVPSVCQLLNPPHNLCSQLRTVVYRSRQHLNLTNGLYKSISMYTAAYKPQSHWSEPS